MVVKRLNFNLLFSKLTIQMDLKQPLGSGTYPLLQFCCFFMILYVPTIGLGAAICDIQDATPGGVW